VFGRNKQANLYDMDSYFFKR